MKTSFIRTTISLIILFGSISMVCAQDQDKGLSVAEYLKKVQSRDSVVFVHFHADWCVPCIKLKPIMDELRKENETVKFFGLDVDENPGVAQYFEINTLPLFYIYKNGRLVWSNNTYMNKKELQDKISFYH